MSKAKKTTAMAEINVDAIVKSLETLAAKGPAEKSESTLRKAVDAATPAINRLLDLRYSYKLISAHLREQGLLDINPGTLAMYMSGRKSSTSFDNFYEFVQNTGIKSTFGDCEKQKKLEFDDKQNIIYFRAYMRFDSAEDYQKMKKLIYDEIKRRKKTAEKPTEQAKAQTTQQQQPQQQKA